MSESILSPELLAAIAKIEGDIRRLQPRHAKGTKWTVYEILASTPEQGCDLPTAMTTAMFGDGYQLSHERRLLAITLARALPTVAALTAENEVLRRALIAHRTDLHNGSSRPCPTCYQSAHALGIADRVPNRCALADADAAALTSSGETTDG